MTGTVRRLMYDGFPEAPPGTPVAVLRRVTSAPVPDPLWVIRLSDGSLASAFASELLDDEGKPR
jgi:hypothetical protein